MKIIQLGEDAFKSLSEQESRSLKLIEEIRNKRGL